MEVDNLVYPKSREWRMHWFMWLLWVNERDVKITQTLEGPILWYM